MKVELMEYPKGKQRFEISLGDVCHITDLERAKELADGIYKLHPHAKAENDALESQIAEFADDWKYNSEQLKAEAKRCQDESYILDNNLRVIKAENEALKERDKKITEHLKTFVSGLVTVEQMYMIATAALKGVDDETTE